MDDNGLIDEIEELLESHDDFESPPTKLSPGTQVIVLRPLTPEGSDTPQLFPVDGVVEVVAPTATADWYKYVVRHSDGTQGVYDARTTKPATWMALSEFIASPESLRDEWQDSLKELRHTETELPFHDWIELRHALADHMLDMLVTMLDMNKLPQPLKRMMDLYYNSGDPTETEEAPKLRCAEFPGPEQPEYAI